MLTILCRTYKWATHQSQIWQKMAIYQVKSDRISVRQAIIKILSIFTFYRDARRERRWLISPDFELYQSLTRILGCVNFGLNWTIFMRTYRIYPLLPYGIGYKAKSSCLLYIIKAYIADLKLFKANFGRKTLLITSSKSTKNIVWLKFHTLDLESWNFECRLLLLRNNRKSGIFLEILPKGGT